ncbi:hypothetical protein Tsubulata_044558 [Turnera subulata]|uniref:Transmembrane protein n=1 Tax=Turnera subulata TaxID=218843 RepID=A0A9Q0F8Y2_9ROSI|nr:hypothetical protein Tsubulata_044558 [Turnera subulata]
MSSMQGIVFATAMVVSTTVLFLAFSKQKPLDHHQPMSEMQDSQSPSQTLRSCLCSEEKRRKKKKKRVQFAENVKDTKGNGEEYRREKEHSMLLNRRDENSSTTRKDGDCRNQFRGIDKMPANRVALYSGILRDRVHRIECSY